MPAAPPALGSKGGRLWCLLGSGQTNKDLLPASVNILNECRGERVGQKKAVNTGYPTVSLSKVCRSLLSVRTLLLLNDVVPSAVQNCLGKTDEFAA